MRTQEASLGNKTMYVTLTVASSGAATSLRAAMVAGTDQSTGAAPTTARLQQIVTTEISAYSGTIKYGGASGTVPIPWPASTPMSKPNTQWDVDTFIESTSASFTAYATCILE